MPRMHPVDSSWIAKIGYEPGAAEVFVALIEGGVYAYVGVPASVWRELVAAESKGTFVNETLKPRFRFRRL
jgi:KTSC domain